MFTASNHPFTKPTFASFAVSDASTTDSALKTPSGGFLSAGAPVTEAARIAIVDDEPLNIEVVKTYLKRVGYQSFCCCSDSPSAISFMKEFHPDVLLLDLVMPEVDGLEILRQLRADADFAHLPVIVLTACTESETKLATLELGISDFLSKPVDPAELVLRVRNVLLAKKYHDQLEDYSERLEQEVAIRTAELEASRDQLVHCLAMAAEFRDDDTGHHVARVGQYAAIIAERMGFSELDVSLMREAAQLHDVGKIGVPDSILLKNGKLDENEFDRIKNHCCMGKDILRPFSKDQTEQYRKHTELGGRLLRESSFPIMKLAAVIAQTHHEKFDGSGYPLGLKGDDIPIEGRIVAVADVFDALSSARPYKPAFAREKCFQILEEGRGSHFDPAVLNAFFQSTQRILETQIEYADQT